MESLGVRRFICRRLLLRPLLVAAGQAAMLFLTQTAVAAEALPVTVPVASLRTLLRSGPGDDFYPTERLPQGTTLEVWAIDDSGYSAVRPVAGSFSWVRADDVSEAAAAAVSGFERSGVGDDGLPTVPAAGGRTGVVVTDGAVARVGSQLNDLRHVSQVALEAGERVRILARVTVPSGRHAGEWLKIEPPSGEFRWAWSADLGLPGELAPVAQREPAGVGLAAAGEAIAAMRDARDAVTQAVAEAEAAGPLAAAAGQPGTLDQSGGIGRLMSGWLPRGTNVFDLTPPPPPAVVGGGAAAQAADELADIDLALSLAVAGPSDRWNLIPIRDRLRQAATRATSAEERTRAEAIDARLARFEQIQGRQLALHAPPDADASPLRLGGMWSSLEAIGSRPVRPGVLPGGRPSGGQPDWTPPDQMETTGRLATVISRRPDAPRWALVDGTNNVLVFVTPQPGVNLAPLVGQQVTVRGSKGYMPEYKRPYLVASEARTRMASVPATDRLQ
jgi:uncharacterized protein YgiM (DUF1202 family)